MKKKPRPKSAATAFAPMMPGGLRSAIQEAHRLWKRGAASDAIAVLVDATNDFPQRIEGFRALWELADASDDVFAAVLGAEGMLRVEPQKPDIIYTAATAYEAAGLVFHAWKLMVRLMDEYADQFDPEMREGVAQSRKAIHESALERFGGDDPQRAIELGLLEEQGQLEQIRGNAYAARQAAEQLVATAPEYAPGHQELAEILFHDGDDEGALASIDRAIGLDPTRADYLATKVEMLHSLGGDEEARTVAQPLKTMALRDHFEARFVGIALWLVGEEEALIDLPTRIGPPSDDDDQSLQVAWSDLHHMASTAAEAEGRPDEEVEALRAKAIYKPSAVLESMEVVDEELWDEDEDEGDDEDEA